MRVEAFSAAVTWRPRARATSSFRSNRARVRAVGSAAWLRTVLRETGNPAHVRWLERRAAEHGGLDAVSGRVGSEEELYAALEVPFLAPEQREGPPGEQLSPFPGVSGVFHVHTNWSDGT